MPLLRRKPLALAEPPEDLKPDEHVYQVRFTKEIFRDYHDYLQRLNLYRQRVWSCKVTGKTGLTYEEAIVSEQRATEKFLQFPKEFMTPALKIIQYSMLPLKELADSLAEKLQERLFVGAELYGKKDDDVCPCKILKVIHEGADKYRYEVAWFDKNKNISEKTEVHAEDLVQKKPLFSRNTLKAFIRESTYRNAPWVLHDKLAQNHGISTDVPEELRGKVFLKDGLIICSKKRNNEESMEEADKHKRKKLDGTLVNGSAQEKEHEEHKEIPVKYPIDDLLVKPSPDDPVFTDRPSPSRDFNVPMHCVGNLLMVWDFCTSFGKQLHLSPYSLEDFENAICHKDGNAVLLVESHAALFRVLIKDDGEYTSAVQKRSVKKITMVNWREYLCDFLEMINIPQLRHYEGTIKRGHYCLVDANAKLEILCELVNRALETAIFREKLDEFIEQRQELGASKREQALEEGRKRREQKERLKADSESNGNHLNGADILSNNNHIKQNGHVGKKINGEIESSRQDNSLGKSEVKRSSPASKQTPKNLDPELKEPAENGKELSRKDPSEKNSIEQRREYFEREMEKRPISRSPLGKDRDYNRYWWFRRDGRIFVESCDSKEWGYYSSKEELDALMGSLNCKGERDLNMGITALGPRKKIVHALSELRRGIALGTSSSSSSEKHEDAEVEPRRIRNQKGKLQHDKSERKVDGTVKPAANKLITEYFPGFATSGKKVSAPPVERNETNTSGSSDRKRKAKNISTSTKIRDIPKWCAIQGTPFRVDAFKYLRGDCSHWFLTHFHMDHYQGLTKSFNHGKIYCSSVTARLVNMNIGIPYDKLHILPLNQKVEIAGIGVTCLDANHCPGSIIILFEPPNGKAVLHTGDFRYSEEMANNPLLRTCPIHTLILDTTYCNPQYDFPKQEAVIQFVIDAIQAEAFNPRTLFLIGSYTIGKERLFLEVARSLRQKVYVTAAKLRLLKCLEFTEEDMQWFTSNEHESNIHVAPMWTLASFKRLKHISSQYASRFSLIVAFSPTGWTFGKGKKKSPGRRWQQGTIIRYEVPYSEHCSFTELKEFVNFVSPDNIIPSVNNDGPESADAMVSLMST